LEALPAEDGTALSGAEGNGSFASALRAVGGGFDAPVTAAVAGSLPLLFTGAAPFGLVLEVLIVEKTLLACGKNKIRSAVGALKGSVLKF
jgi:hypothetical protein